MVPGICKHLITFIILLLLIYPMSALWINMQSPHTTIIDTVAYYKKRWQKCKRCVSHGAPLPLDLSLKCFT